jgi:hypothetical protein
MWPNPFFFKMCSQTSPWNKVAQNRAVLLKFFSRHCPKHTVAIFAQSGHPAPDLNSECMQIKNWSKQVGATNGFF